MTPTVFFTRPYALLHVAIFDALNALQRRHAGYATELDAPAAVGSVTAAQAARDVMVEMFPSQRASFGAALAATLARAGGDQREGIRVGQAAAAAVFQFRAQ